METLAKLEIQLAMQTMQKDGVFTYNTAVNLRLMRKICALSSVSHFFSFLLVMGNSFTKKDCRIE